MWRSGGDAGRQECLPEVGLLSGGDAHEATAVAFIPEIDDSVDFRKERVIASDADILAGVEARATLANDDRPTGHELTSEALDAQHLRLRIATIARRALSLFMCHR